MNKIKIIMLGGLFGFAALFVVGTYYLDSYLLKQIRAKGANTFSSFEVSNLKTSFFPKIGVRIDGIHIVDENNAFDISIQSAFAKSKSGLFSLIKEYSSKATLRLDLEVIKPEFVLNQSKDVAVQGKAKSQEPSLHGVPAVPISLKIDATIKDGVVKQGFEIVSDIQGTTQLEIADGSVQSTGQLQSNIKSTFLNGATLPLEANWLIGIDGTAIKISELSLGSSKIVGKASGEVDLSKKSLSLKMNTKITDLSTLPWKPAEIQKMGLYAIPKGSVNFDASITGGYADIVIVAGHFLGTNIEVNAALEKKEPKPFSLNGIVKATASVPFEIKYDIKNSKLLSLSSKNIELTTNLDTASLTIPEVIEKRPGIPMSFNLKATGSGAGLDIQSMQFILNNLKVESTGHLSIDDTDLNTITFQAGVLNLEGWPGILPALRESKEANDAKGALAIRGKIEGARKDFSNRFEKITATFEEFNATDLSVPISYKSSAKGIWATGRILGTARMQGHWKNGRAELENGALALNFGQLEFAYKDLVSKSKNMPLMLEASLKGTDKKIDLEKLLLVSRDTNLSVSGTILLEKEFLGLNLNTKLKINLGQMKNWSSYISKQFPSGLVDGAFKISGNWLPSGLESSPLLVDGKLTTKVDALAIPVPSKSVANEKISQSDAKGEKAKKNILPKWPIFQKSKIAFVVNIDKLDYAKTAVGAIGLNGQFDKGNLVGSGKIGTLFGGSISIPNFILDLTRNEIVGSGSILAKAINLKLASEYFPNDYVYLADGIFNTDLKFQSSDFLGGLFDIQLASLSVQSPDANLHVSGKINKNEASFSMSISPIFDINTPMIARLLPTYAKMIPPGSVQGKAKIYGTWDEVGGIEKSPINFSGDIKAKLGAVTLPPPENQMIGGGPTSPPNSLPKEPILPNWPIARGAAVTYDITIASLKRGDLSASDIALKGNLKDGKTVVALTVESIFGGKASISDLKTDLSQTTLDLAGSMTVDKIALSQATAMVSSEYSKIVGGSASGSFKFETPDPRVDGILKKSKVTGELTITDGFISTVSFDKMINEKLSGLPGFGAGKGVSSKGVTANVASKFSLASGKITLEKLMTTTPEKNELDLSGWLNLDFLCDFSGQAHLAVSDVSGAIKEANSDSAGRIVVPIKFSGSIKEPKLTIAQSAIEEMLKKTAANEIEKAKRKLASDAKKAVSTEIQKALGNLFNKEKK